MSTLAGISLLISLLMQAPAQTEEIAPAAAPVSSVTCAFIRKNSYQGFSKVAKGHFHYDAGTNAAAYEYEPPFNFRFIINDTAIIGIDTKHNVGYEARRGIDSSSCNDLSQTVDLFDTYLRCLNAAPASLTIKGVTGTHQYIERHDLFGTDVFARDLRSGAIDLMESFDTRGALYQQIHARFNEQRQEYEFPVRIVVRRKCAGALTSDTVLISETSIDKPVRLEWFSIPAGCRLHKVADSAQALFSAGP